ncbi:MAG: large subunit ribosomal protein [Eubacteriaceae bacterium]|jgi:large subunit ribosomal protein L21|nr:large subunit ribosomal protein [Eubacteriaceae bacterium]MDK2905540.1 large subunit ribosomal protein [Eubacteriaceae bacterium]MDK2936675.1 large subunit ribosomal protein [Eubacteriaceae bacterium]MDK2961904.1 large subunit ribosomal protein [Eubacteriaceae bacterium]MDN5306846.1 large subunit ribosomal protein [Eubacteriaceae bacterium]
MYAIIKTGGKQYRVQKDDVIQIEKINFEEDDVKEITFTDVLAVNKDGEMVVGAPVVENAVVKAEILEVAKGPKVIIFKYKSKKDYRKKQGHRQPYMKVKITGIEA